MKIYTYSLGELQANCYLLEQEGKGMLIDPGDDASFILEELLRKNIQLVGIYLTHGHFDHAMAAGEIQMSFQVPLYIHKEDQFLIERIEETAKHFLDHKPIIIKPTLIHYFTSGDFKTKNSNTNFKFQILSTPGHTPGSVCFYFPDEKSIFTGDTLFARAVGRTDFAYGDKQKLRESLKKILELPDETEVYPGHGESTYIMEEKKNML